MIFNIWARCIIYTFICNLQFLMYKTGFHLSATVIPPQSLVQAKGNFSVAVVFDRRRITSCTCTCSSTASWCSHVVSLCLYRIHQVNIMIITLVLFQHWLLLSFWDYGIFNCRSQKILILYLMSLVVLEPCVTIKYFSNYCGWYGLYIDFQG